MADLDELKGRAEAIRGRLFKVAGVVIVLAAQARNIADQIPEQATGLQWAKLYALAAFALIVAVSWWAILSDAFGRSFLRGVLAFVCWPYTIIHGLVLMPGVRRAYGAAFTVSVAASALSRWLWPPGAG